MDQPIPPAEGRLPEMFDKQIMKTKSIIPLSISLFAICMSASLLAESPSNEAGLAILKEEIMKQEAAVSALERFVKLPQEKQMEALEKQKKILQVLQSRLDMEKK